jgi:putative holliday junction resolvase
MPSARNVQPSAIRAARRPVPSDVMADEVVLGFDFGMRRTGIAIANTVTRQARPLSTIEAETQEARWTEVQALVDEWHPTRFVVGIPRHPDGTPHEMTGRCERFARQLEGRFGCPVARVDERYSSAVSERAADVDADAAVVILQQWLSEGEANA